MLRNAMHCPYCNTSNLTGATACAACGAPLPDWAADEFRAGIATMRQYRSRSWSEVFGEPYQGKHLDSLRLRRLKWEVWHIARAVTAGKKPKKPRDEQTFGEVGRAVSKKFGVRMRATTARELFYEAEREVADLWATLDAPPRG